MMKLESVNELRQRIERVEYRLRQMESLSRSVAVPVLDGMPRGQAQDSVVERYAVKILEAEAELDELNEKILTTQEQLLEEIYRRVDNPIAVAVLVRRYVEGQMFKVIAVELGCSEDSAYYFHRVGRKEFLRARAA